MMVHDTFRLAVPNHTQSNFPEHKLSIKESVFDPRNPTIDQRKSLSGFDHCSPLGAALFGPPRSPLHVQKGGTTFTPVPFSSSREQWQTCRQARVK